MDTKQNEGATRWRDAVNLVLGIWLLIAPQLLTYGTTPEMAWNAYIVGAVVAIDALLALFAFGLWEEWVTLIAGAWMVVSPWTIGVMFQGKFDWNSVVVGVVICGLALWSLLDVDAQHSASA